MGTSSGLFYLPLPGRCTRSLIAVIVVVPRADETPLMRHPHPCSGSIPSTSQPFPAAAGSHLSSRFLGATVRYDRVPFVNVDDDSAALPILQLVHRTIGSRPPRQVCNNRRPARHMRLPCHIA